MKNGSKNRTKSESTIINITLPLYFSFNIPLPKFNRKEANTEYTRKKSKTIKEHKSQTKLNQAKPNTKRSEHVVTLELCSSFGYLCCVCVIFQALQKSSPTRLCINEISFHILLNKSSVFVCGLYLAIFVFILAAAGAAAAVCLFDHVLYNIIFDFQDVWAFALYIMISPKNNNNMLHLVNTGASYLLALLGYC